MRHGADATLRDEHGLTALEKARERTEDGHREVVALLEHPDTAATTPTTTTETNRKLSTSAEPILPPVHKMDEAVADVFLRRLLPVFCRLYHESAAPTVRRASLALVCKATMHISAKLVMFWQL